MDILFNLEGVYHLMDVLIFSGQSNMQGQSEALTDTDPVEGALEYRFLENSLIPLKNPVGEDITTDGAAGDKSNEDTDLSGWLRRHALGAAWCGCDNMVPAFCRAYIKECGRSVVAVHAAKGSTEIADWLPGTDCYRMLIRKTRAAMQKTASVSMIENVFFIWLQGESDAIEGRSAERYKKSIRELAKALKDDINIDKFAVIRVGRFTEDARDIAIMNAQNDVCRDDPQFLMLTEAAAEMCGNPRFMNPHVGGHFSAEGFAVIGDTAGKALGQYVCESGK